MEKPPHLVCIVDDDSSVRRALGRIVNSFGFETKLLASGRQCLDEPHIGRAACIIIDVSMPGIDGFELQTLLNAAGHHVPTVFISAYDSEEYQARSRAAGCIAFLNKPCDEQMLRDALDKAVAAA
jgi:FixJ family two-component response regulator